MYLNITDITLRLAVALLLGMSIGIERAIAGKTAGVRTHALVAMGSAMFMIVGMLALGAHSTTERTYIESMRVIVAIITGIGFLGAGIFISKDSNAGGMTTAAGIWVAAGVGISAGYGFFSIAVIATLFTLIVFTLLWDIEHKVKIFGQHLHKDSHPHRRTEDEL